MLRIDVGDDACGVDLNVKRARVHDDGEREVGQVGLGPADQAGLN